MATPQRRRFWVQIGSGPDATALPDQFRRLKSRHRSLFDGISGYVAKSGEKARLVLARPGGQQDPGYLVEAIKRHRITTLQVVPTLLRALAGLGGALALAIIGVRGALTDAARRFRKPTGRALSQ